MSLVCYMHYGTGGCYIPSTLEKGKNQAKHLFETLRIPPSQIYLLPFKARIRVIILLPSLQKNVIWGLCQNSKKR